MDIPQASPAAGAAAPGGTSELIAAVREQSAQTNRALEFMMSMMQPLLAFTAAVQQQQAAPSTSAPTSAPLSSPSSSSLPHHLKTPSLEVFNGRNSREVAPWLNRAKQILQLASMSLETPLCVAYVAAHLTSHALKWFEMVASTVPPDQRTYAGFLCFDAFSDAMQAALGEHFPADKARDRLHLLKQRSSVADYGSEFQRCISEIPDMDWQTVKHFYLRGLKDSLRIMITGKYDNGDRWNNIHLVAMQHDELSTRNVVPSLPASLVSDDFSSATPMDLGMVKATRPVENRRPSSSASAPHKPLTPEERTALMASGGCFYCRKVGHRVTDCPAKLAHEKYLSEFAQ